MLNFSWPGNYNDCSNKFEVNFIKKKYIIIFFYAALSCPTMCAKLTILIMKY